jgi:two-component system NtrC family sensor kinase
LTGKSFVDLGIVPHEHLRKGMKILELSAERVPTGPNEFELIRKDGGRISVEVSDFPIGREDRIEIIVIARDITDRKRMEQQLQLTGRLAAVGELAAGVAHELNNPLAAVQAYAQLLCERTDLDATAKGDMETIYGEAVRASKITSNLLSFAREHKPEKRLVSMNQVVAKSLELHAYRMKVSNIEVELDLDPDLPLTMADFHQLQQVFVNIIANAEQAMTDANGGGRLLIQTRKNDRFIHIGFTDNGPGIPEKDLKRIFDPFFTTKDVGKGTGLGLSICYGIVQGHRGNMYAPSTAGKGATFVVEIPIVPEDEPIEQRAFSSWSQGY